MAAPSSEIVHVRGENYLIDSAWRARPYTTGTGRALETGYYLVLHARGSGEFDRRTRYYGPFPSRRLAETLALSARHMGLTAPPAACAAPEAGSERSRTPRLPRYVARRMRRDWVRQASASTA